MIKGFGLGFHLKNVSGIISFTAIHEYLLLINSDFLEV